MQTYPRSPDLVWPGHLHGSGCLSARAVGTWFPTVGLRLWFGPGCGWVWVLLTPTSPGWVLGWVCLGSVCGVVPLLPAVCGVRGWALVSAFFWDVCGFVRVSLAPRSFRFWCAVWACVLGPCLGCAPPFLAGLSGCVFCAFFFLCSSSCWVSLSRALWSVPISPFFLAGLLGFFFLWCVSVCFGVPLCLFGVLSLVPSGSGVWPPFVLLAGCLVAVGCFRTPPLPRLFLFLGGGGWLFLSLPSLGWRTLCGWCLVRLVPRHSWRRFLCATPGQSWLGFAAAVGGRSPPLLAGVRWRRWCVVCGVWCVVCGGGLLVRLWLVCGVVGPSPLLAQVPVCYSPPLLAWFRCRWWWAVSATPGWGPLAAVVCGVWCVVCGVWRWCVGGAVAGVWCGWSLATPGGGSCVLLPATPGWVSLPLVVGGPRHSWLWSAGNGGVWCVVCGVWCMVCGGGVLVGLWLVCGVVGPSPLLAEVPVCYSPPLLARFRCRWWWAFPATPGWGPLAAVVCGVWCVVCGVWRWCVGGVVAGVWCGWFLATPGGGSCVLLPATPGWVSLYVVVGGPRHSWLGSAGGDGVWCVACGVWCVALVCWWGCGWCVVWLVPCNPWRRFLCATPRQSWLGFAAGGGGRSPPLLTGVRWRRWSVVCAVWCVVCGVGVLVGLWLVCCVLGPSPLLAEVPVC